MVKLTAAPVRVIAAVQAPTLTARSSTRRARSVSTPMGTVARAPTMLTTDASRPMAVLPTPKSILSEGATAETTLISA